jgi:hypothetical protein
MSKNVSENDDAEPQLILYQTEDGRNRIDVRMENDTVWLTQAAMAELFQTTKQNISFHLLNIFRERELDENSVVKDYLTTAADGKNYVTRHFSLDAILAVGYRVRSPRGTQFRQWATERLHEYLVKGFTLDDERLKGRNLRADHFDELLARIREIRASEIRVYQRIREIFALASDYVERERETKHFFAVMQNKMHFAAAGMTAAEIIRTRADAAKPNMGLTAWTGSRVFKRDVATAKNYLNETEIDTLNRIVVMFLDQAEFRAQRRQDIRMQDWEMFLDKFLRDTELPVLADAGAVAHDAAVAWAHEQYDAFAERRRHEAEAAAEARYLDDLRGSAQAIETARKKLDRTNAGKTQSSPNGKRPRSNAKPRRK